MPAQLLFVILKMKRGKENSMDVECTLNTYDKDCTGAAILKVSNVVFDGKKVRLTVITKDFTSLSVNVIGDELISAVQKCILNWRGV